MSYYKKKAFSGEYRNLSKLVITFVCENKHDVETVTIDLKRRGEVDEKDIWQMMTRGCRCTKCGCKPFTYRTRYKV
ncbi:conserved hypothetical protein [anaerobic digester metagenome]|uniref:Uncharacterized protein n=1 Tax=anaerobic digester metagenome TaxID=1263854 RepID=A0A485M6G0_9ZZZZ